MNEQQKLIAGLVFADDTANPTIMEGEVDITAKTADFGEYKGEVPATFKSFYLRIHGSDRRLCTKDFVIARNLLPGDSVIGSGLEIDDVLPQLNKPMTNMELIIQKVRVTLQDVDAVHWADDELEKLARIAAVKIDNDLAFAYPEALDDHLWYETVKMARGLRGYYMS